MKRLAPALVCLLLGGGAAHATKPGALEGGNAGDVLTKGTDASYSFVWQPVDTISFRVQAPHMVLAGPTSGANAKPTFRLLTAADLPAGSGVTSVGLSLPALFSVSGSPVTSSGTLTASLATQAANSFLAGPSSGSAAAPTFRLLALADLPTAIPNGNLANSSVTLSLPSRFTGGGAVSLGGTLTIADATQSANRVFAGPTTGSAAAPTFRALVAADVPALAYVTSVGLSLPGIFSVSGSPVTSSGTLSATLGTQAANLVWAGPSSGVATAPTFRALAVADLPTGIPNANLANSTITATAGTGLTGTATPALGGSFTFAIDSTVATLTGTQTLTNKTISGASNTLSNIANSSLTNSSITVTAGTGLSGGGTPALGGSTSLSVAASQTTISSIVAPASTALTLTGNAASTWSTSAGALTITSAGAATWDTASGTVRANAFDASVSGTLKLGSLGNATGIVVNPVASTSGANPVTLRITAPAHTTLTASELIDVYVNLGRTVQFTGSSTIGAANIPVEQAMYIVQPTYSFSSTAMQTIAQAATLYIAAAPTAGTNCTITSGYALWVGGGLTELDGGLAVTGGTMKGQFQNSSSGNEVTTVGAAGGAAALPATPVKYLVIKDSSGTNYKVPLYNP